MKVLAVIMIALSFNFSEVGKSSDGTLQASVNTYGDGYLLTVDMSNLLEADRIVIYTTNDWKVSLKDYFTNEKRNFLINQVQSSVLKEEEILKFSIESGSNTYTYESTDRSFLKFRLD